MKTLHVIIAAMLLTVSTSSIANCTTHTILINGKIVTCTTCCIAGNCITNCF